MTTIHDIKFRRRGFQSERRRVQRQVVQSVLLCGLILIIMYALIVIATGIFIVYTQFFAPEIIANLNGIQTQNLLLAREKRMDERLIKDPIARLLQADEINDGVLQTFAPYEDYDDQPSDEEKQVHNAAAALENFENSRLPLEFSLNRWIRSRKLLSIEEDNKVKDETINKRQKRSACPNEQIKTPNASTDTFPTDLFTLEQRQNGVIVLHLMGLCYMFVSLAIVCDEFFVPSLSVISEVLEISDDVAGATFMAAGGSAPEFFTSVFGVFITSNNVGVGTIVGSATFNILFVLSFCTFFSRQTLHLTWWPLFRDMFFYVSALLLLLIFFIDEVVDFYEALCLFGLYIIYGIFMKYNTLIERTVKRQLMTMTSSVGIDRKVLVEVNNSKPGSDGQFLSKHLPIISTMRTLPVLHSGAIFRAGLVNIAMDPSELAGPGSDSNSLHGDQFETSPLPTTPTICHPPLNKTRSNSSMRASLPQICLSHASSQIQIATNLPINDLPNSSRTTTSIWSTSTTISHSKFNSHNRHDERGDLSIPDRSNINGRHFDRRKPANDLPNGVDLKRISVEIEPEQPVDMRWPKTFYKRCVYVILAPIMYPLYYTLPDVKKPNRRQLFLWTFCGSIVWIAFYSYLMVWWANTIGETVGMPSEMMGLTILAAGTSIPDLITSVIVARKGLGDMAVSSSIGSNLFDVCVGLPVPWLLYYAIGAFKPSVERISVESNGLICSVGMLFMMLLILYVSVAISGWKMSKKFGFTMIVSYMVFCSLSILLEIDFLTCPLKRLPSSGISC